MNGVMVKILMIEDDVELAEILMEFLEENGISVTNFTDPILGIEALNDNMYSMLLLDLTLPNMDGLEICKKVVKEHKIPIIISSARNDTQDKISALEYGADDYLPKPYDPKELLARIHSVLRRYKTNNLNSPCKFILDNEKMCILYDNVRLNLTRAEYEILSLFIKHPGRIFSRADISNSCTSIKSTDYKSIDVIIGRLRSKIEDNNKKPRHIISVRGFGYRFDK